MPGRAERKEMSRIERRREDKTTIVLVTETPHRKKRGKTVHSHPYGLEIKTNPHGVFMGWMGYRDWTPYWQWYSTPRDRDQALAAMNRKDTIFEYRPYDRLPESKK